VLRSLELIFSARGFFAKNQPLALKSRSMSEIAIDSISVIAEHLPTPASPV
jgi:hypothetical protein